jgi:hypothetical protein
MLRPNLAVLANAGEDGSVCQLLGTILGAHCSVESLAQLRADDARHQSHQQTNYQIKFLSGRARGGWQLSRLNYCDLNRGSCGTLLRFRGFQVIDHLDELLGNGVGDIACTCGGTVADRDVDQHCVQWRGCGHLSLQCLQALLQPELFIDRGQDQGARHDLCVRLDSLLDEEAALVSLRRVNLVGTDGNEEDGTRRIRRRQAPGEGGGDSNPRKCACQHVQPAPPQQR